MIQTSNTVDHWSTVLQTHKNHAIFDRLVAHYFDRCFPADHSLALRSEPHSPYCTDLYSSSYPRGNDVTLAQYLEHARQVNDVRFLDSQCHRRLVNLIFNKPEIPQFCQGSAVVTVTIQSEAEQRWVYQTLWQKHWIEQAGELIYAPDDPYYCHLTRLADVLKYNNTSRYSVSQKSQLQDKLIYRNHTRDWYLDAAKFVDFDQHHGLNTVFIPLSSFFDRDQFVGRIQDLCRKFDLDPISADLIDSMRSIWTSRQIPFDA